MIALKARSLRFRFALWTALLILVVLAAFGAAVYLKMAHDLGAALDASLQVSASQIIASLNIDHGQLTLPDSLAESPSGSSPRNGLRARILSPDGKVLEQVGEPIPQEPPDFNQDPSPVYSSLENPPLRIYSTLVTDNNRQIAIVQVAQTTSPVQSTLDRLLAILLVAAPLLVLAAGLSGYMLAARALRPIDAMTSTARRISAEDLGARLNLSSTDDELGRLAATLDGMLARLEDSFRRERQFTADASHELRTPLAAMQTIIGVTRHKPRTPAEYEEALDDLAQETERLRALTEGMLILARSDSRQSASPEAVDLSTLLEDITESMRPLAEVKGLALHCSVERDISVAGNRDDLIRLFANLLDNAIKYTPAGQVNLEANRDGNDVHIQVRDSGFGIAPEHLPHIFERFYRVAASRTSPGTGLGLSLAKQIVEAHGGSIAVESEAGHGTRLHVRLPTTVDQLPS
jgi:heavy metal sensor kinase